MEATTILTRGGDEQVLIDALATFLANRASAFIPMKATCFSPTGPSPKRDLPPSKPQPPEPEPAPEVPPPKED